MYQGNNSMADNKDLVARFIDGYSCSQTILTGYCSRYGVDETTAVKIAAGFGAGMQRSKTCGAVTGAIMVLASFRLVRNKDAAGSWRLYKISSFPYLGVIFLAMCLNFWL